MDLGLNSSSSKALFLPLQPLKPNSTLLPSAQISHSIESDAAFPKAN